MKLVLRAFATVHAVFALGFVVLSLLLLAGAVQTSWVAVSEASFDGAVAVALIEAIGLLTVGVVSLPVAQTIAEEEVVREEHVSAPTRVRPVPLALHRGARRRACDRGPRATMKAPHEEMALLPHAAAAVAAVGALIVAWGVFVRLNRSAEDIEPEVMGQAKDEARKLA